MREKLEKFTKGYAPKCIDVARPGSMTCTRVLVLWYSHFTILAVSHIEPAQNETVIGNHSENSRPHAPPLYRRLGLAIMPNSARMGETAASDEYAWNVRP